MLTLSAKIFYTVEAVLYIAYNAKVEPVAGNLVAQAQNLPVRYLEPMMQKLVRAGILRSLRGPQGGYMLGRERRNISLADICDALGKTATPPVSTTTLGAQVLAPTTQRLLAAWHHEMGGVTLAQLCEDAEKANIPTATPSIDNFTI